MPTAPKRQCANARSGCPGLAEGLAKYCPSCQDVNRKRYEKGSRELSESRKRHDAKRGTAHQRGYTGKWQKARAAYLAEHPLCCECMARSLVKAAHVVDHIVPHRGDRELFWDRGNWQALCAACHNRKTRRGE